MPIFLSHKREDKDQTLNISGYLRNHSVQCYVDVFDPELQTNEYRTISSADQFHRELKASIY